MAEVPLDNDDGEDFDPEFHTTCHNYGHDCEASGSNEVGYPNWIMDPKTQFVYCQPCALKSGLVVKCSNCEWVNPPDTKCENCGNDMK